MVEAATAWVPGAEASPSRTPSPDILVLDWAGSGVSQVVTSLPRGRGGCGGAVQSTQPTEVAEAAEEGLLLLLCVQGQHGLGQAHWAVGVWGRIRGYCGARGRAGSWTYAVKGFVDVTRVTLKLKRKIVIFQGLAPVCGCVYL